MKYIPLKYYIKIIFGAIGLTFAQKSANENTQDTLSLFVCEWIMPNGLGLWRDGRGHVRVEKGIVQ
jgi:hypothetical protein